MQDWSVSLPELMRMVQLYNAGADHAECGTEDGYASGQGVDDRCVEEGEGEPLRLWKEMETWGGTGNPAIKW